MKCTLLNESNCTNLSLPDLHLLALVRGSVGIGCFSLCLAAFLFELLYICRRKSSSTLQRLFIYLTLSNLLYTAALSCHIEHYFDYSEAVQCVVCKTIGFLDQYTGSVQLLFTLGISFKLFHKISSFWRTNDKGVLARHYFKFEALFVTLCFVLPLTVIWVPFTKSGPGSYGLDHAWCWIQALQDDCRESSEGFLEQLLLWYIPFAAVSTLSLICIVAIIAFLIYIGCHNNLYRNKIRVAIMDMLLLLPFLVAFCCVWLVEVITTILLRLDKKHKLKLNRYILWMCYAIITPIGGVVIPIAFFVYFLRKKRYASSRRLREISNIRTAKASSRVSANSHTSQQDRPGFLSNSDVDWETSNGSAVVVDPSAPLCESSCSKYGTIT